ncbi:hypothetical protein [Rhodococcus opacus]|uniref:three-helix bundle dimerization domain-containing protein n=1 Tax=Rhodococcus TaxID=1827 RepID=UPI001422D08A|nr:hypothetical protein [Rhodococcus opacus]MDV6247985.1 hypothetical protein [Rhodococcus opacus]NHU49176.1 hypothetical protein [Rhodococcus sp. A14]
MDDREEHEIDVVRTRLIERYPDLDPVVVEGVIVAALGRLDGCRVRDFVPLLVERAATRTLGATLRGPLTPAAPVLTPEVPAPQVTIRIRGVRRIFVRRSPRLS